MTLGIACRVTTWMTLSSMCFCWVIFFTDFFIPWDETHHFSPPCVEYMFSNVDKYTITPGLSVWGHGLWTTLFQPNKWLINLITIDWRKTTTAAQKFQVGTSGRNARDTHCGRHFGGLKRSFKTCWDSLICSMTPGYGPARVIYQCFLQLGVKAVFHHVC